MLLIPVTSNRGLAGGFNAQVIKGTFKLIDEKYSDKDVTVVGVGKKAMDAFRTLTRVEGIMPAIESSHAVAHAMKMAKEMDEDQIIVVNLSGRGDKDIHTVAQLDGIKV